MVQAMGVWRLRCSVFRGTPMAFMRLRRIFLFLFQRAKLLPFAKALSQREVFSEAFLLYKKVFLIKLGRIRSRAVG
jgi:hypothetical protein